MPKGQFGCFHCGSPTGIRVQIWQRVRVVEGAAENRHQRSAGSVTRYFCDFCGEAVAADLALALSRRVARYHGCARCGVRATHRIQLWAQDPDGTTTKASITTSYCDSCAVVAYADAVTLLGGPNRASGATRHADPTRALRARRAAA